MQMVAFRAASSSAATPTPAPTPKPAPVALSYVQANSSTPSSHLTAVTVPFALAQSSGDLNVVIVGWHDATTQVFSFLPSKAGVGTSTLALNISARARCFK